MYGRYPQELKILNSRLGRLTIMLVTDISHVGYVERRLYIFNSVVAVKAKHHFISLKFCN